MSSRRQLLSPTFKKEFMECIILFIIVTIILILLYGKYNPHIDAIKRFNKHTIILWYNKITNGKITRTFIKLFEYER